MSLIKVGAIETSGAYTINRSLRFRSSVSAYLSRTPASAGNQKTWTWSCWAKRGVLGVAYNDIFSSGASGGSGDEIGWKQDAFHMQSPATGSFLTTALYRDPSAWYHLVVAMDTSQATSTNRLKVYVNGVQITSFQSITYPSLNAVSTLFNTTTQQMIGAGYNANGGSLDGYLAEINFIDGQQLTPSSFGSTNPLTGVWQPTKYTGTYGTNGFYLNFSDNSALTTTTNVGLGKDFSGNANRWTTNAISITAGTTYDSMTDVPTNTSANASNYCVLNPINTLTTATLSNGNLAFTSATTGHNAIGSIGMTSGKYYWEAQTSAGTTQARGTVYGAAASTYYSFAANATVYGFRFDADTGTLDYTTNGSSFTSLATGLTSGPYFPYFNNNGTTSKTITVNFGQQPFTYTPPTGYVALNTYNLPTPTILKGNSYMDATTYTGNLTGQSITNAGAFKPDLVWIKSRSAATDNKLTDFVRGTTKALISNTTGAETTDLTGVTAFNTNGFTLGASTVYNNTGATYVGWQWAGSGTTVSNTNGSITSTVDANTTAGFSIVTYTGTGGNPTVGHGLGVAPKMIIIKSRSIQDWQVYHASLGNTSYLQLNTTGASATNINRWNNTSPTSTVFTLGTAASLNTNAVTYVAYCWSEIAGFSKFGTYTGNGSTDGTFVYTGFRPKFFLVKNTAAADWQMYDTSRDTYNEMFKIISPDSSGIEDILSAASTSIDFLSNGIKLRRNWVCNNLSGNTYVYMAFAENPFKYSLAR